VVLFFCIILAVVCIDQASKAWIIAHFSLHESWEIIPGLFNLTHLTNNGAAFGILAGQPALWRQIFFIAIAGIALVCIWMIQRGFSQRSRVYSVALALIAGGAIGNLIDRIRWGFVVDFLDFYLSQSHWPAFNAADSAITVGVTLFVVYNLLFDRQ
jgi:signal peptidase II